jgi:hypothetical protein
LHYIETNPALTLVISIAKIPNKENRELFQFKTQWSDGDNWNPASKANESTVGSNDIVANILSVAETTFCTQVTIIIEDESLCKSFKILTGQIESDYRTRNKVINEISYNSREKDNLSSFIKRMNVYIM